ncbi:MAG: TetR/AcrR family transcriptional regulator [Gammaproteobacteria bacterium]
MRRSREDAARTRQEIVKAAATLLRERGLHGVSVADLMSEIGLTHGGFYTHFESKEALMSEAMEAAFSESMSGWHRVLASAKTKSGFASLVDLYLGEKHLRDPKTGCAVPALGSEIARASTVVQESVAKGINDMIEVFSEQINDVSPERKKERAIATVAGLVGAMVMARCVRDEPTARSYLQATRNQLLGTQGTTASRSRTKASRA